MGEAHELSADDSGRGAFGVLCVPAKRSAIMLWPRVGFGVKTVNQQLPAP